MQLETIHTGFEQTFRFQGAPFTPCVHLGKGEVNGANTIAIRLDATPYASLKWEAMENRAQAAVREGFLILWELDLGLFGKLPFELEDEAQLLSLELGIDHFKKTLLSRYRHATFGVILYRGDSWLSKEQKDYLKLLAAELPEEIPPFLLLDARQEKSYSALFHRATDEDFEHFQLAIASPILDRFPHALPVLKWEGERLLPCAPSKPITLGVCLSSRGAIDSILGSLEVPFRILPEGRLTYLWDGLDHLIVVSNDLGEQGRRKLLGFCAAGGTVITVGKPLDLPLEVPFEGYKFSK